MAKLDTWRKASLAGLVGLGLTGLGVTGMQGMNASKSTGPTTVRVWVEGAVQQPKVLTMPTVSTVKDAIDQAGGAIMGADLESIDLNRKVSDGMRIKVASFEDVGTRSEVILPSSINGIASIPKESNNKDAPGPGSISINSGTKEELMRLPRVGEVMAQRIIDYRSTHGGFRTIDELNNVKGIGDKTLEKIRPFVRL